ncbi:MAG: response regulator [Candidatus Omnitrophica bacterium]|nr:response regulator [Candidatus Omnitrophota bacterium]
MAGSIGPKFSILIVDDDRSFRSAVQTCFPANEYSVVTASDGRDALDRIEAGRFDLVITDLQMPRMDGLTLIEVLCSRFPAMPLIVMTACSEKEPYCRFLQRHSVNCLAKPFRKEALLSLAQKLLEKTHFSPRSNHPKMAQCPSTH